MYKSILYINNVVCFFLLLYPFICFLKLIHKLGRSKLLIPLFLTDCHRHFSQFVLVNTAFFSWLWQFLCYRGATEILNYWWSEFSFNTSPCTYRRPCVLWIKFVNVAHIPFFSVITNWGVRTHLCSCIQMISIKKILFHRD